MTNFARLLFLLPSVQAKKVIVDWELENPPQLAPSPLFSFWDGYYFIVYSTVIFEQGILMLRETN